MAWADDLQRALLTRGLSVASIPGKGRGLVTTRDFSPGEVIIYQEPYAASPNKFGVGLSSCDGCFASNNLKKCSACRIAWYCGNRCQKSEWKLHQAECQALASLAEDKKKLLTPTLRLIVRLLLRRKLQDEQVIPTTATDNYNLVNVLESHINDIDEKQLVLFAQMANLIKLVLPLLEIDIKEVTHNFSKLACNAHTICDDELRPLGTGLYPVISIINHSCMPNSVLMFEGRVAYVRALVPLPKDTENSDEGLKEDAILEGYRCKDMKCNGYLLPDSEEKVFTCQLCGFIRDGKEIKMVASKVTLLSENASSCLSSGKYSEASALYKTIEQLQQKLHHPFSIYLLQTHETLLKIFMELKDWEEALAYCRLTIPIYQRIYPAIHPMTGLQFYTCGKLEWLLGRTEDALRSFTKATDILRITHGTRTPFMRELISKLEEVKAEASFKLSGGDY
ncbi:histone-lysine N-methyltransferase ASHR1 isoform X2 [Typha angustifolia]|uniref:histone-lysine N-methyltransferase ASHR1 isoform X2 n=1 Tax=Typha angustifolia TaxID=59011 RepID=UPI003C2EEDB0